MRIGVDLDGTLANLASAWHAVDDRLFGARSEQETAASQDETTAEGADGIAPAQADRHLMDRMTDRRRRDVWRVIQATAGFWTTLAPIEDGVVRRLYDVALAERWEVFFLTQRPPTAGDTVQRQSQRWLADQGFEHPSVLTLTGSRGAAAAALYLDVLIDDLPRNCLDVVADSQCRPFLVLQQPDEAVETSARRLDVTVVPSVGVAIDMLIAPDLPVSRPRARRPAISIASLFGRGE